MWSMLCHMPFNSKEALNVSDSSMMVNFNHGYTQFGFIYCMDVSETEDKHQFLKVLKTLTTLQNTQALTDSALVVEIVLRS